MSRDWSHAALHAPLWDVDWRDLASVDDDEQLRKYPFLLIIRCDNLDVPCNGDDPTEHAYRPMGRLTSEALAGWIYSGDRRSTRRRTQGRAKRLVSDAAASDWAQVDAGRVELAINAAVNDDRAHTLRTPRRLQTRRREKNQRAQRLERAIRDELRAVLADGLERRAGKRLRLAEKKLFFHLAARVAISDRRNHWTYVDGWQVCDRCDIVFPAHQHNARWCVACRRSRPPRLYPFRDGGWHVGTHGDPADATLVYFVKCRCGAEFSDHRATQRLCANCRNPAGRVRHHRQRKSAPATDDARSAP